MEKYPDWNNKFFPIMHLIEKDHYLSYYMSPLQKIIGIGSKDKVVAYSNLYNKSGHRIYSTSVDLICKYVDDGAISINPNESKELLFTYFEANLQNFNFLASKKIDIPTIYAERIAVLKG